VLLIAWPFKLGWVAASMMGVPAALLTEKRRS
jgi:hypothetical protein